MPMKWYFLGKRRLSVSIKMTISTNSWKDCGKPTLRDHLLIAGFCDSAEDKRALEVMVTSMKRVKEHYQIALPWRGYPPCLPNNKIMAERRALLLKKRLNKERRSIY